ncbi:MAG: hypothetical protein PHD01_06320 [Geobacteraceae bacterium]|nr:hypothetical protein [Geobacteraceae bacterium]
MKGKHTRIDLHQQFIEVFNKEEMLAFFDFRATTGKGTSVSGLCKVSKPKDGKSDAHYFSLLFIIETPDEETWREVESWFSSILWDNLEECLPELESVLSIPFSLQEFTGNFFQEIDIYVKENTVPSRSFILETLFPGVRSVSGIEAGEPVFWEDLPRVSKDLPETSPGDGSPNASLMSRLKDFFSI